MLTVNTISKAGICFYTCVLKIENICEEMGKKVKQRMDK